MQKSIQKQVNSRGQCLFSSYTHSLYTRRIPVIVSYLQFYLNSSWLQGWIAIIPHQEGKNNRITKKIYGTYIGNDAHLQIITAINIFVVIVPGHRKYWDGNTCCFIGMYEEGKEKLPSSQWCWGYCSLQIVWELLYGSILVTV